MPPEDVTLSLSSAANAVLIIPSKFVLKSFCSDSSKLVFSMLVVKDSSRTKTTVAFRLSGRRTKCVNSCALALMIWRQEGYLWKKFGTNNSERFLHNFWHADGGSPKVQTDVMAVAGTSYNKQAPAGRASAVRDM